MSLVKVDGKLTHDLDYRPYKGAIVSVVIDLDDIDTMELEDYARWEFDLIDNGSCFELEDYETRDLINELRCRGVYDKYFFNSDIRTASALEKLFDSIDKIPIEKIEELIKDF